MALARVPVALLQLAHDRRRTLTALAGVAFAVLFMFMQLGFLGAVDATAVAITSRLTGQVALVAPEYLHLSSTGAFPRARLLQAAAHPGVERASALYVRYARWVDPGTGRRSKLFAVAFSPWDPPVLDLPELPGQLAALRRTSTMLVDVLSQPRCGPLAPGTVPMVREKPVEVVGQFRLGVGFLADGALVASDETFSLLFDRPLSLVQVGVLRLREGQDPARVVAALRGELPPDVRVLTVDELTWIQRRFWVRNTSLGNIFALGAALGFCVGVVVLYQVLATDVTNHLPQYATLKAMGYPDRELVRVVLAQAGTAALLGFAPGLGMALGLYALLRRLTNFPIDMPAARALGVLAASLVIALGAGALALRKLRRADPADLY